MNVVTLEGKALEELLRLLGREQMNTGVYRLRVAQDEHGVYIKANEDVWSVPLPAVAPVTYTAPAREYPVDYCLATFAGYGGCVELPGHEGQHTDAHGHRFTVPPVHRTGAPVRLADGRWLVACPCGWRRTTLTLSEATRAVRAHLAGADLAVGA